jgi:TPR repeat protein
MSDSSIALSAFILIIGVIMFLLVRMSLAERREAARKRQALVDSSQTDPTPEVFLELGKISMDEEQHGKALEYFAKAAELGSSEGAWRAANIHLDRNDNLQDYFGFMLRSAELGDGRAMVRVAAAYKEGKGTLKNIGRRTY